MGIAENTEPVLYKRQTMRGSTQGCSIVIDWFHPKKPGFIPLHSKCPSFYGTIFFPFQAILSFTHLLDWLIAGVKLTIPIHHQN
jgi:hypothetical protein